MKLAKLANMQMYKWLNECKIARFQIIVLALKGRQYFSIGQRPMNYEKKRPIKYHHL